MPNSYNPRLVRSIIAFASLIMSVFLAITAVNAWAAYRNDLNNAERRAETTADLLHQQIQTTIETSELVLDAMVMHGQKEQIEGPHVGFSDDAHLMHMASKLPFSPWLLQVEASGGLRYMQKALDSNSDSAHRQATEQDYKNPTGAPQSGQMPHGHPNVQDNNSLSAPDHHQTDPCVPPAR